MKFSLIALAMLVSTPVVANSGDVYYTNCEKDSKVCAYSVILDKTVIKGKKDVFKVAAEYKLVSLGRTLNFNYRIDCKRREIYNTDNNDRLTDVPWNDDGATMKNGDPTDMRAAYAYVCKDD